MAELGAIGIVSRDLARSAAFYRLLGVDGPDPDGDHLEVTLLSGVRLMWDDVELIRKLDPEWRPAEGGPAVSLAFECASPGEVDEIYATVVDPDSNAVHVFASL